MPSFIFLPYWLLIASTMRSREFLHCWLLGHECLSCWIVVRNNGTFCANCELQLGKLLSCWRAKHDGVPSRCHVPVEQLCHVHSMPCRNVLCINWSLGAVELQRRQLLRLGFLCHGSVSRRCFLSRGFHGRTHELLEWRLLQCNWSQVFYFAY